MAQHFYAVLPQVNDPGAAPPLALSESELNKIRLVLETMYYPSKIPPPGQRHYFLHNIGRYWNSGRTKHQVQQVINMWDYCQSMFLLPKRQAKQFAEQQRNSGAWDEATYSENIRLANLNYFNSCDQELSNYFLNGDGAGNAFINDCYDIMIHPPNPNAGQG
jgi:hypothetical protein